MITIAICDNDPVFSENLYDMIWHAISPIDECTIQIYRTGREIIEAIENNTFHCQLMFMDILMDEGTGFQTAQYICEHISHIDLIFVTASETHVFECYHYHAFAYLLKPVTEHDIIAELRRYFQNLGQSAKYLPVSYQHHTWQIPINSILYIESNLRKIAIHTHQTTYYCYQKLSDIAEQLKDDGFVRCHQSYLFALNKVTHYSSTHVYIHDVQLPVSNRYQASVRELLSKSNIEKNANLSTHPISLNQAQIKCGALICIRGTYLGSIIRIHPEQEIVIGRDGTIADLVINLPLASRRHCTLTYHCDIMKYEVRDFSSNGTFVDGDKRLLKNETYLLKPGSEICFGDKDTVYKLG